MVLLCPVANLNSLPQLISFSLPLLSSLPCLKLHLGCSQQRGEREGRFFPSTARPTHAFSFGFTVEVRSPPPPPPIQRLVLHSGARLASLVFEAARPMLVKFAPTSPFSLTHNYDSSFLSPHESFLTLFRHA